MTIRPPAPFNSLMGIAWLALFVVLIVVGYRKFAPVSVQTHLPV